MFDRLLCLLLLLLLFNTSSATTFALPDRGDVVGDIEYTHPQPGETLAEVGVRYDMGYHEMLKANPHVDPDASLSPSVRLLIPSRFTLPKVPYHGLVISLKNYRLFYFPENDNVVITYPVGIGRKGWDTPTGITRVVGKQVSPTWRPTASVLAYAAEQGVDIPEEFPPGPINPLGKYVLRLGWPTYLIHGSNNTDGVGVRISAGCIRLLPDDMEYLYGLVPIGTPVRIVA